MLASLAETLLNLHRGSEQFADADFRSWALAQVQPLLGFDRAFWGTGAYVDGGLILHTRSGYRLPSEIDAIWERNKHLDETVPLILQSGGRMVVIGRGTFCRMAIHNVVWGRFGVRHGMGTAVVDPATGLLELVCFLHHGDAESVSEEQRQIGECLVPHLIEAWRVHRLKDIAATADEDLPVRCALMDRTGVLHSAEHGLAGLLRTEWPEWEGARLPSPLVEKTSTGRSFVHSGERVVAKVFPSVYPDLLALLVRQRNELDRLTSRELEVARLFASGLSYKAVAARLGLSPQTVRVHLSAIYKKTGVSNKAALAALMSAADHP